MRRRHVCRGGEESCTLSVTGLSFICLLMLWAVMNMSRTSLFMASTSSVRKSSLFQIWVRSSQFYGQRGTQRHTTDERMVNKGNVDVEEDQLRIFDTKNACSLIFTGATLRGWEKHTTL